jgi:hypothetical protein
LLVVLSLVLVVLSQVSATSLAVFSLALEVSSPMLVLQELCQLLSVVLCRTLAQASAVHSLASEALSLAWSVVSLELYLHPLAALSLVSAMQLAALSLESEQPSQVSLAVLEEL